MGWLEVLALLKRLGPALSRVLPMLEMFAATRGEPGESAEVLDRIAGEIKKQLAVVSTQHDAVVEALLAQAGQLGALRGELSRVREADERSAARLLEVETQVSTLAKTVLQVRQLLIAVLVLGVAMLAALGVLFFRR